jgi:hypothetical protein
MKLHLNIGLARNDGRPDNGLLRCIAVLNQSGFLLHRADVQASDTEPTLCASVHYAKAKHFLKYDLHTVSCRLAQDCIVAVEIDQVGKLHGELHGPECAKWAPFDQSFFLFPQAQESA